MKRYILVDNADVRADLLPLTYLRPVAAIRVGIDTIAQKWQALLPGDYGWLTAEYLTPKYPRGDSAGATFLASHVLPYANLCKAIDQLQPSEALYDGDGQFLACNGREEKSRTIFPGVITAVKHLPDIFMLNSQAICNDFARICGNTQSRSPERSVTVIGPKSKLFIHPDAGAVVGCTINTTQGPVYIGAGAEVMEGACLRGPLAVCEGSVVRMGAKVYGQTTIGPHSKVGGELDNVVIFGYSNKAHDGYLGNAVIAEWCNLGAGCTASNLKNDYTPIKLWNYPKHRFVATGLQFCGLIMADHSKAGINTMLNTATVLGVGVNIHGSGFPRPFVASFCDWSPGGYDDVQMQRFFDTARVVMARRGVELTEADKEILNHVRQLSEAYR